MNLRGAFAIEPKRQAELDLLRAAILLFDDPSWRDVIRAILRRFRP